MIVDDAGDVVGLGRGVEHVALERPAKQDAVGPRKHVAGIHRVGVADLGLGQEDRQLSADGDQLRVREEVARTKPGAIEDQRLGLRRLFGGTGITADDELAACD